MQITRSDNFKEIDMNMVGSSSFGRYDKISTERSVNWFESDGWMVPYPGYLSIPELSDLGDNGRAIYTSNVFNLMVAVIGNTVYSIVGAYNPGQDIPYAFNKDAIGNIDTFTTNVFIAENNAQAEDNEQQGIDAQILICDGSTMYCYKPNASPKFQKIPSGSPGIDFIPASVTFHNGRFAAAVSGTNEWRLSDGADGTNWPNDASHKANINAKPDTVVSVVRFPSKGNMVFVMGENVAEPWFDVGYRLFPYQPNQSFNVDYGCINAATIGSMDEIVVWLAQNEKSGPVIMASDGGTPTKITTDGIDYLLSNLKNANDSEAFMYRQDGHLFYHINFITDNFSLFYDFNTQKFYNACDESGNYFIAKQLAFYKNQYYFVSRKNGNIYAMDTIYPTYDGAQIPRIRIPKNFRQKSQEFFVVNDVGFTIEQGDTFPHLQLVPDAINLLAETGDYLLTEDEVPIIINDGSDGLSSRAIQTNPRVDFSFSTDGGVTFGNTATYDINSLGNRRNMLRFWNVGLANDFVPKFIFWGFGKFIVTDGYVNIRT